MKLKKNLANVIFLQLALLSLASEAKPLFPRLFAPPALPKLGAETSTITVSGLSSGAFMAVQLGVAYSDRFSGVAAVAGGIYNCSLGKSETATGVCMKTPEKIDVAAYVKAAEESSQKGFIADPKNLSRQRILIMSGTEDKVVAPLEGQKLAEFYQAFGAKPATEFSLKMGHGFPSSQGTVACEKSQFPWVNKCETEGAERILSTFYGPLTPPPPPAGRWSKRNRNGELAEFDQTEFGSADAKMSDSGHVFIPKECTGPQSKCRLHVALHGCLQNPTLVREAFIEGAGYNRWAETNKIIVLYPATTVSPSNGTGCWDWFGYTNEDFAVRKSLQMTAMMKMVERLTSPTH